MEERLTVAQITEAKRKAEAAQAKVRESSRVGVFHLGNVYYDDRDLVTALNAKMKLFYLDVRQEFYRGSFRCVAHSPFFRPVPPNQHPPHYNVHVTHRQSDGQLIAELFLRESGCADGDL